MTYKLCLVRTVIRTFMCQYFCSRPHWVTNQQTSHDWALPFPNQQDRLREVSTGTTSLEFENTFIISKDLQWCLCKCASSNVNVLFFSSLYESLKRWCMLVLCEQLEFENNPFYDLVESRFRKYSPLRFWEVTMKV